MLNDMEIERGLKHVHGWINYAIASGVPEAMMWEWLFHTKAEGPIVVFDILTKVNELIRCGRITVRQMFDIASEAVSHDYDLADPDLLDMVRGYLQDAIRNWENGY